MQVVVDVVISSHANEEERSGEEICSPIPQKQVQLLECYLQVLDLFIQCEDISLRRHK